MKRKAILSRLGAPALVALSLATAARGANVTMTADDTLGTSSFNSGLHWSDATAPAAGNSYDTASFLLRTPADGNNYTFGGDSLTITSAAALGADLNDGLLYKGTATSTITVNNLTVNGGALRHANNEAQVFTLAGNGLTVGPSGMAVHVQGPLNVTSPVSGSGPIRIMASGSTDIRRVFELDSAANTYTGSIELTNATQARFHLADTSVLNFAIGATGTNNRIFGSGGVVALDGKFNFDLAAAGTTPGDTWQIVDNATLTETFGPSFAINGFTDNGDDTWSTVANGATYTFAESTGALTASPVPEPTALTLLALAPLALTRRRRRQPD
jgi:hypothetical protein